MTTKTPWLLLLSLAAVLSCTPKVDPFTPPAPTAPSITAQPTSVTVAAGQTATFMVTAEGTEPLSYQWQKDGADVAEASGASYTTKATSAADTGARFRVVVSNATGSVTSDEATLTVEAVVVALAPTITMQPAPQSVIVGQAATFSVTAESALPLSYQWRRGGVAVAGETSASLTTAAAALADTGALFSVVVSNSAGSVVSNSAALTVTAAAVAPSITTQPANALIGVGSTATFSVAATGTAPLAYQWRRDGVDVSGANSATFTTPPMALADSGGKFTVVVSNAVGRVTSAEATLTVQAPPVAPTIATQPTNVTVNAGETAAFRVVANGTQPITYQWRKNGAAIAGATSANYTTPPTALADSGALFSVVLTNSAGAFTSGNATLTVNAVAVAPIITTQPASLAVTVGQTANFSVAATGAAPLAYQWQKNGAAIAGATSASYTTPVTVIGDSGAQFSVIVSNGAGSATSSNATLTVNGQLDACANVTCSSQGQCARLGSGAAVCICNAGFFASGLSCIAVVGCDNVDCNTGGSCAVVNNMPACTCGPGYTAAGPTTCLENAAPFIRLQPLDATVALGQQATFSVTASGQAPLSYQWRKNGTVITNATSRSYTTPATTTADNAAAFSVVVSNAVGMATSATATLTVAGAGAPVFTTQPQDATATPPTSATFAVTVTGHDSFRWQRSDDGITWTNEPVFNNEVFLTPATTAANNGRRYRVRATNAATPQGVFSNVATLTVLTPATEAPTFTTQPLDATVTTPATATFTVVVTGRPRPMLQWQESTNGATWTNLANATGASFTTPATTAALNNRLYRVVATNSTGQAFSAPAKLNVRLANGAPTIGIQPTSKTVPLGNSGRFEVLASGAGTLTYQWRRLGGSGPVNVTNNTWTSGATTQRLQIENGAGGYTLANTPMMFDVVVSNTAGSTTSHPVTLATFDPTATAGTVTTLAGNGTAGSTDGTGAAARFTTPGELAIDAAGNLYVADTGNHTIRKVTPAGVVTTVAGLAGSPGSVDGPVATARFDTPSGIAVTPDGTTIYVSEDGVTLDKIRKITAGMVSTLAGGFAGWADGVGASARFDGPGPLGIDSAGNLYLGEIVNFTIRRITPAGVVTTVAGLAGAPGFNDGTGPGARFRQPFALAVDSLGNIYVGDGWANIFMAPPGGGQAGPTLIRKISPAGVVVTLAGGADGGDSSTRDGIPGGFAGVSAIAVDAASNVYVGDGPTLRKVTPAGVVSTVCGTIIGLPGFADGPAVTARFRSMAGLGLGPGGTVYISDGGNFRIRKFVP